MANTTDALKVFQVTNLDRIPPSKRVSLKIRLGLRGDALAILESRRGGFTIAVVAKDAPTAISEAVTRWEDARRAVLFYRESVEWACTEPTCDHCDHDAHPPNRCQIRVARGEGVDRWVETCGCDKDYR